MPIIHLHDNSEYSIEGYGAHQETRKKSVTEYATIENHEIIETNREYKYYSKYFYCQVNF